MILPKDVSESILVRESGANFADDMSYEVFSSAIENHLYRIVNAIVPDDPLSASPISQDISEESLMKELEGDRENAKVPISVSADDVRRVLK